MHSPILFNDALLLGLAKLACQITRFAKMRRAPARFPPVLPSIQTQQPPPPPTTTTPAQSFFAHLIVFLSLLLDLVDSLVYICIRCDWSNVINVFCFSIASFVPLQILQLSCSFPCMSSDMASHSEGRLCSKVF